ncbi:hypothetical protein JNB63_07310 [Microbacterium trichothecenolyticum]|uniref:Uncharacterized protein n=1 Tax=Microbacterium ureisolvens TaxID=2781186 RepID=A0ABS7HUF4_9MICO|nr:MULTISPECIES: hypothetical protein [Microbacterium]MBW9108982.1 hypothetical protein [Microbacterium ureisolvens]MBW9119894.1 hypothetical protein [Microbacterium trichothecenolyticum]
MTTTPTGEPLMLDPAAAEAALYRVAICTFTWHPNKEADEPGWTIAEDLDWCLAPLAGLPNDQLTDLRATVQTLITTPTADRRAFIRHLAALSGDNSFDNL